MKMYKVYAWTVLAFIVLFALTTNPYMMIGIILFTWLATKNYVDRDKTET